MVMDRELNFDERAEARLVHNPGVPGFPCLPRDVHEALNPLLEACLFRSPVYERHENGGYL